MLSDAPVTDVTNNSDQNRFELRLNGDLVGIVGYYEVEPKGRGRRAPVVSFMHAVITEDFGHRGLAGVMVRSSLDRAREYGWKVRPVCTYVQRFVAENPEYRDVLEQTQ
ncbi:GNAT family N-acetyltransferase [Actinomycetes bacterium M1A6_2h]